MISYNEYRSPMEDRKSWVVEGQGRKTTGNGRSVEDQMQELRTMIANLATQVGQMVTDQPPRVNPQAPPSVVNQQALPLVVVEDGEDDWKLKCNRCLGRGHLEHQCPNEHPVRLVDGVPTIIYDNNIDVVEGTVEEKEEDMKIEDVVKIEVVEDVVVEEIDELSVSVLEVIPLPIAEETNETSRYSYIDLPIVHPLCYDVLMGLPRIVGYCDVVIPIRSYKIFVDIHWSLLDDFIYWRSIKMWCGSMSVHIMICERSVCKFVVEEEDPIDSLDARKKKEEKIKVF